MATKPRTEFLQKLDDYLQTCELTDYSKIRWTDGKAIRDFAQRIRRDDTSAWSEFLDYLCSNDKLANEIYDLLEKIGFAETRYDLEVGNLIYSLTQSAHAEPDLAELIQIFFNKPQNGDEKPKKQQPSKVMYIEEKPGLAGHARIGRVTFSASRKTIYFQGRRLQTLRGSGYKANYINLESGLEYWISNCKKDGNDTLYPGLIEIDEDAREEYWLSVRNKPENLHLTKIRSLGKYSKRRPS